MLGRIVTVFLFLLTSQPQKGIPLSEHVVGNAFMGIPPHFLLLSFYLFFAFLRRIDRTDSSDLAYASGSV